MSAKRAQPPKKAKASQEVADRRLYRRYRNDPERQEVAPVLTRLAREGDTPAKKGPVNVRALRAGITSALEPTAADMRALRSGMADAQQRAAHFNADRQREKLHEELVEEAHRLRLLLTRMVDHAGHPVDCPGCGDARAMLAIPGATKGSLPTKRAAKKKKRA